MVLTPGWRGHGTVNGIPAEGFGFMQAWDNGSYISPIFYAIDVLNLIEGIGTINDIDWASWGIQNDWKPRLDAGRIHINGHSQGGDVALTVLAVSGENSAFKHPLSTGTRCHGCFVTGFEQ